MQRDGQLHYAQVRAEMTAVPRYRFDEERTDLGGELNQLILAERLDITRAGDRFEQCHLVRSLTVVLDDTVPGRRRRPGANPTESISAIRVTCASP